MPEGKQREPDSRNFNLLAVIVLYKMTPNESSALSSLQAAILHLPPGQAEVKILLYDNTPGRLSVGVLPEGVQYKADSKNGGLAKAYNYALDIALEKGYDWLLTLDQDTSLPIDFLCKLSDAATFVASLNTIAAIVPYLSSDGRIISPQKFVKRWALAKRFPDGFTGVPPGETIAANSASTIRVSALKSIGGYDPRFYIWCSDIVLFHRLYCNHFGVFVAGNIHAEHELAGFDLKHRSTPDRHREAYFAEEAFYDEFIGKRGRLALLLKIFRRMIYGAWIRGGGFPHLAIGLRFFCRRLFYMRRHRMKSWEKSFRLRSTQ
jgi:GT2 family glycosyltransferase